jgi:hypothetical protein
VVVGILQLKLEMDFKDEEEMVEWKWFGEDAKWAHGMKIENTSIKTSCAKDTRT